MVHVAGSDGRAFRWPKGYIEALTIEALEPGPGRRCCACAIGVGRRAFTGHEGELCYSGGPQPRFHLTGRCDAWQWDLRSMPNPDDKSDPRELWTGVLIVLAVATFIAGLLV
jgi:hypothetical protein